MKIGLKLIISFELLALLVIVVVGYALFAQASEAIEERTIAQLESVVVLKENRMNDFFKENAEDLTNIQEESSSLLINQESKKMNYPEDIRRVLNGKLGNNPDYIEFFVLDPDGNVYASTNEAQEGKIKSNEPYFTEGKNETFVQSFYYDSALQQPAITISTPLKDNEENVVGVLAGRLNLEKISEIMVGMSGLGETGETYLVNKFNFIVTESRFEKDMALKETIYTDGVKDCLEGNNGHGHYIGYRNSPVIGSYAWIPERDVCLLAEIDQDEAFAPINRLKDIMILFGIGTAAGVSVLGIFLSRKITNPINELIKGTEEVRKGDLSTRVNVRSGDEIEQLAIAFNQMTSDRKRSQEELKKTEEEKREELGQLVKERTQEIEEKTRALEGSRLATLNILEDVSEAKDKLGQSYSELKKLDSMKDDFVNIGAHELKTPLIPVIGYLSMVIKDPGLSEGNRKKLEIAFKAARREEKLVKDVLDISKLESGAMKFEMEDVNIQDLVDRSVQEMQSPAKERGIVLESKSLQALPKIRGDPQRLEQVITNLIGNAIKFTDKGSVTVEAKQDGSVVVVSVKDTGIGIPKEAIPKLFVKFYQVETTLSRNHEGTGLGLAICRKIIEAHNGRIWVESTLGQGSTFSFTLPIEKTEHLANG